MAKRQPTRNEDAWRNAKKLFRLSRRQVAMARALGMNPKKLPGLRPSPQQRWKLSVGAFIEACYRRRFGGAPESDKSRHLESESWSQTDNAREMASEPTRQTESLVCYLANLSDDLQKWLVHGAIAPGMLAQVREELRRIADALETGTLIPEVPGIPVPPDPPSARSLPRDGSEHTFDGDDEIPF